MTTIDNDATLEALEAVRDKLNTAERRWLDAFAKRWRERSGRITAREWVRVVMLTALAKGR